MADASLSARLEARVSAARRALSGPALVRAWGWAALWIAGFAVLWLSGALAAGPAALAAAAGLVFYAGGAWLVWRSLRRWRRPTDAEARGLIDEQVEGRPLSSWTDRPVGANRDAHVLWEAHRERLARVALGVRRLDLSRRWRRADPFHLRFAAPAVLVLAAAFAGGQAPDRLRSGLAPDFGALFGADRLAVEAWITPPVYTGDAPVVLTSGEAMLAPEGSVVTLRVISGGRPVVKLDPQDGRTVSRRLRKGVDGAYEAKFQVDQPMEVSVNWWGERARFPFTLKPDLAPQVAFVSAPEWGASDATQFKWSVKDDYGVARLELVARLAAPAIEGTADLREAEPVEMIGIEPREEEGEFSRDLTRHRWAGLDVMVHLRAYDVAGRMGRSLEVPYRLPDKLFLQPLAQSAQEIRVTVLREHRPFPAPAKGDGYADQPLDSFADVETSRLDRAPEGVKQAAAMIDAVTYRPEDYFRDPVVFLGFRHARSVLGAALGKPEADSVDEVLWATALRAEFGSVSDAEAALQAARRALENALRNGASEEEIRRLMDAFRQAVENYLAAKMAEAIREGRVSEGDPNDPQAGGRQPLGDDALQRMLDTLQDLAETGASEQARQMLSELDRMLQQMGDMNLRIQQGGGQGQQEDGPISRALRRALNETNQALGEQRDLADQTEQAGRESEGQQGQQGRQGRGQQLADRQRALREQLEQQSRRGQGGDQTADGGEPGADPNGSFGGEEGPDARRRLSEAIDAQRRAEEALRRGDFEAARRAQQEALDSLAARSGELARQADAGDPDAQQAERDVLGRALTNGESGYGENIEVPDEMERQRARDILEEIRRRAANRQLRPEELEYLQRLLERF